MEHAIDIKAVVLAAREAVATHVDELTALDAAIGDGDHGVNLKRGFDAVAEEADQLAALNLADALSAASTRLVMHVGGASGPLFATFLKALSGALQAGRGGIADVFDEAVDAVARRGRSGRGEKTLLDVLFAMADALRLDPTGSDLPQVAAQAARDTIPLVATKGRAAYLGPRSAGHMDPGARSVALITIAVSHHLAGARP
jgi:phosphoenolpyruvate---glycerone phosphotransferase subunit DhaL